MLALKQLQAAYGTSKVLFGVDLEINGGQTVTLLGRNGMGKTTTVRCITGLLKPSGGEINFCGQRIDDKPSYVIARLGMGLVPEGRQIFPNLTVKENLIATASNRQNASDPWKIDSVMELFPGLVSRINNLGEHLSGGEQQMLAIGRALMTNPQLLILDEATEGLAPLIRQEIWKALRLLKQREQSVLVIDKNLDALLELSDRHYIMERGEIVWQGDSESLKNDTALQNRYLGI